MRPRSIIIRTNLIAAALGTWWWWKASAGHRPGWITASLQWLQTRWWLSERTAVIVGAALLSLYLAIMFGWLWKSRKRQNYHDSMTQFVAAIAALLLIAIGALLAAGWYFHWSMLVRWVAVCLVVLTIQLGVSLMMEAVKAHRARRNAKSPIALSADERVR